MLGNCQAPVFFHSSQAYGLTLPLCLLAAFGFILLFP